MSKITDNYDDYKDGLCCIEDYEYAGWKGKITIKKPLTIEYIQPNKPIDFFFSFFEKETRSSALPSYLALNASVTPCWELCAHFRCIVGPKAESIFSGMSVGVGGELVAARSEDCVDLIMS